MLSADGRTFMLKEVVATKTGAFVQRLVHNWVRPHWGPASYIERILEVTASYQRGLPLSEKTIEARQQDERCLPDPDPGATKAGRVEFMKLCHRSRCNPNAHQGWEMSL